MLVSPVAIANLVEFEPHDPINSQQINGNFNYLKNILSNKNVSITFRIFVPGELILKETFQSEFNKLRLLGLNISDFSEGPAIKSNDLNAAFAQSESEVVQYDDVPIANNLNFTLNEDSSYIGSFDYINQVGTATVEIISSPTNGILTKINETTFSYQPNPNYNGNDNFSYRVFDGESYSETATAIVNISPINDAPLSASQNLNFNEDTTPAITLAGSDVENSPLVYTIISQPTQGSVSISGNSVSYIPSLNYSGPDSFSYQVNDGDLNSPIAVISLTLNPVNDIPVAIAQNISFNEDSSKNIMLTATDSENNPLTYSIVSPPVSGTLSGTIPNLIYTPNLNYNGSDSFSFKVNDGFIDSVPVSITLTIDPVNDEPLAMAQSIAFEGTNKSLILSGSDIENSPLVYTIVGNPTNGTLSGTAPNLTYTTVNNYIGTDSFSFKVNDGELDSAVVTVSFDISSGNFWGNGQDGSVTIASSTNFVVPNKTAYDGSMVVKQYENLTINSGAIVTNDNPSRGLLLYVKGDLVVKGEISMTARGASVPSIATLVDAEGLIFRRFKTGSAESNTKVNPLRGAGTLAETLEANQPSISGNGKIYSIARLGAGGGAGTSGSSTGPKGGNGVTSGAIGYSGGGGAGGSSQEAYWGISGPGKIGTAFSGGSGGVGRSADRCGADNAALYGGLGGYYSNPDYRNYCGGGAGNPGGTGYGGGNGANGTGGLIVLVVRGNITIEGTGKITSKGSNGGYAHGAVHRNAGGGASGGGNVLILHAGTYTNNGVIDVAGGIGGAASGGSGAGPGYGGAGGNGSVIIDKISK